MEKNDQPLRREIVQKSAVPEPKEIQEKLEFDVDVQAEKKALNDFPYELKAKIKGTEYIRKELETVQREVELVE